jgi:hypothetical protein
MARIALSSVAYDDVAAILRNLKSKAGDAIAERYDAEIKSVSFCEYSTGGARSPVDC